MYVVKKNPQDKTEAIFTTNGQRVSDWFDRVFLNKYAKDVKHFLAKNGLKYSIFEIGSGKQVSDWFDFISEEGLLQGLTEYYIAGNDLWAIFHVSGKQISDWYDYISSEGLVLGFSSYYIAYKDGKSSIFHVSGKQISDWHTKVFSLGLVLGQSEYYIAYDDKKYTVFHYSGRQVIDWQRDLDLQIVTDPLKVLKLQEIENFVQNFKKQQKNFKEYKWKI